MCIRDSWKAAQKAYLRAISGYEKAKRVAPVLALWGRLAWVCFEANEKASLSTLNSARQYAEDRELRPLVVGCDIGLGLCSSESMGMKYFESAWAISDAFNMKSIGARARYLFARRYPNHPDCERRLNEALDLCGLSKPLEVLIKAEMC